MGKKIYIVHGYKDEHREEIYWIEDIFENEEQANACCKYLGIVNNDVEYSMSEHEICTYNYVNKLKYKEQWILELEEEQEKNH